MLKEKDVTLRRISAKLPDEKIALAKAYIQGAVYSHCNNIPEQEFSGRILFGGDNRDWHGTPLQEIYEYHCSVHHPKPEEQAAKDMGWLLKEILAADKRTFVKTGKDTGWRYKLVL